MDGIDQLLYVRCCMEETLWWMPTTIMGVVPYTVNQDDEYLGYLIPKNAGVLHNVWGVHTDPDCHPIHQLFDPDCYQGNDQSLGDYAVNLDVS